MKRRPLGQTDLHVSELGFGCARLGGTVSEHLRRDDAVRLLHEAFDLGINFFDTAGSYGQGRSEERLGQAFRDRRNQVVLASKAGYRVSAAAGWASRIKPLLRPLIASAAWLKRALRQARATHKPQDFSPAYLTNAVEESLKRLQTDYLDLFQLHNPPPAEVRNGDVLDVLDRLQNQGKIRHYGISCRNAEDATLLADCPGVSALQVPINLIEQQAIDAVLPWARQRGLGVIARQPLASGFLARPASEIHPDPAAVDRQQAEQKLQAARRYGFLNDGTRTLAEAALRFVLQQEGVSVTLVGTTDPRHLRANLAVLDAPVLTGEEMAAIRGAA